MRIEPPAPPPPSPAEPPDVATKPDPSQLKCSSVALVSVLDGDTIRVSAAGKVETVRLSQIDAPERSQSFGLEATSCLASFLARGSIRVCRDGTDTYGRTIAEVFAGGVDVGEGMVRQGCAWAYRKYLGAASPLPALEQAARLAKLGLWAQAAAVEPWTYRSGTSPVPYNTTTGQTVVRVTTSNLAAVHDRVFDWAEHKYPDLLPSGTSNQALPDGTIYRCYATNICVGYRAGRFLFYDGSAVQDVGSEAQLLELAAAQGF